MPSLPSLPKMPELADLPAANTFTSVPPTEAYATIARGATQCWFGAGGPLKKTYIFYADAEPPSAGGNAEIALQERADSNASTPRGAKAYRIALSKEADGTRVEHTNHKLAETLVHAIQKDVQRFAKGDLNCAKEGPTAPNVEAVAQPATPATPAKAPAPSGKVAKK